MNAKRLKYILYSLSYLAPFGYLIGVPFDGDWSSETRILAACLIFITVGLWGVYDEKVKDLEARLERLEPPSEPTQPEKTSRA